MNRFVVTKGQLVDGQGNAIDVQANPSARGTGSIVAGTTGYALTYNLASQRATSTYREGSQTVQELYTYAADGLLHETYLDGMRRAQRLYDAGGNAGDYYEYDTAGSVSRHYQYTYTADNQVKTENDGSFTSTYSYDAAGNLTTIAAPQSGGTTLTTTYSYAYWDSAKQKEIKVQASNQSAPGWAPGFSQFTYDVNGHLTQVSDTVANRHLSYKLDADGRILQRNELIGSASTRTQNYYYLNGVGIGDAGGFGNSRQDYATLLASRGSAANRGGQPVSSADFDYSFLPINDTYPEIKGTIPFYPPPSHARFPACPGSPAPSVPASRTTSPSAATGVSRCSHGR